MAFKPQSLITDFMALGFDIASPPPHLASQSWSEFYQFLVEKVSKMPVDLRQNFVHEGLVACLRAQPTPLNEKSLLWLLENASCETLLSCNALSGVLQVCDQHSNENVWNKVID